MMSQSPEHVRACYDAVAGEYAERFDGELAHKPLDRELLDRFAGQVRGGGLVYDLGCGHGETTAFLQNAGVQIRGLDLTPQLLAEAAKRHPDVDFIQGDMLALPCADSSLAGVIAFYSIVHFGPTQLPLALSEMHRVLKPGGRVLLSFHAGPGLVHVDEFLGKPVSLDFMFFPTGFIADLLSQTGFTAVEIIERDPYPNVEYPSRRAYVFARKADEAAPRKAS